MCRVLKSGSLNFLEPSGPVQACKRIALPIQDHADHLSFICSTHTSEFKTDYDICQFLDTLTTDNTLNIHLQLLDSLSLKKMSRQKWHAMPGDLPSYFRIFNLSRCSLREKSAETFEMTGFIKPSLVK